MYIVTATEMYELDRLAMEEKGLDGKILMENAGQAVAKKIKSHIKTEDIILILIGSGNNGGDGYVIARYLYNQGYSLRIIQLVPNEKITGDAAYHKHVLEQFGAEVELFEQMERKQLEGAIHQADILVDAMLGIGVKGSIRSPFKEMIKLINDAKNLTIAVDVPSGMPMDGTRAHDQIVRADYTYVIGAAKTSMFHASLAPNFGHWEVVEIGLPTEAFQQLTNKQIWGLNFVQATLPKRSPFSHKGTHGKGVIIGGSLEMPGSITMAAKAALRSGIGLLTVATVQEAIPSIAAQCTEATFYRLAGEHGTIVKQPMDLSGYDVCLIGMGMGRSAQSSAFTKQLLEETELPVVVDADGLNHIKDHLELLSKRKAPTILTPHPGEMATLLKVSVAEVVNHPFQVAKDFAKAYGVYLVLKGTYTIITTPEGKQWVNTTGNAGLAKGGSGDTLAGIIMAMIAQNQSLSAAIANSCFIHGKAAELLVEQSHSSYDLLATDVIEAIPSVIRTFLSER